MNAHSPLRRPAVPQPPQRIVTRAANGRPAPKPGPPPRSSQLPIAQETSAGGLVVKVLDGQPYAAIIARRNRAGKVEWCLPKGHLEAGESPQQAALREVSEETGISGRILKHLATIDYWFSGNERRVHKIVHHYLMDYVTGEPNVEGDPDREAEEAAWIPLHDMIHQLAYPNERRVVALALDMLYQES